MLYSFALVTIFSTYSFQVTLRSHPNESVQLNKSLSCNLNVTARATTRETSPSPPWRWLASTYVDAVVTELTIDDSIGTPLGDDSCDQKGDPRDALLPPDRDESYEKLVRSVYDALLTLDRRERTGAGRIV